VLLVGKKNWNFVSGFLFVMDVLLKMTKRMKEEDEERETKLIVGNSL